MHNSPFDFHARCSEHDCETASRYIGSLYRPPDLIIAPDGYGEYLFRWYVTPQNKEANVYFHVQTASDPERPLHDHPWDNTSVILAGGYEEIIDKGPGARVPMMLHRVFRAAGDVVHRPATWAHRLILPPHIPYTMTLFSTGPKVRNWGFWLGRLYMPWTEVTIESEGGSTWNKEVLR